MAPGDPVNGLTVIITTSPTPSAPSTGLVSAVLQSFGTHCPDLLACPVIVVLDTFDHVGAQPRLKKGVVTDEGAGHHDAYRQKVKRLVLGEYRRQGDGGGGAEEPLVESSSRAEYGFETEANSVDLLISRTRDGRVTFVEPSKRLGFGLGVRSGLRLADTPYVWIQQHDWTLAADIPVRSILGVMDDGAPDGRAETAAAPVKYVCLPSVRMRSYATSEHVAKFPALRALTAALKGDFVRRDGSASDVDAVPLTPLFFWHDKPHVASTAHYLDRVFPTRLAMPRGAFIEDLIGHRARDQMKEGRWARWACWLYYPDDGKRLCVRHLQGRTRRRVAGPGESGAG